MKTRAVRLYGAGDIRLEEFALPDIGREEILVRVMTDSICMSTYKFYKQGQAHKRCPPDVGRNPVVIGHEFSGDILRVGERWQNEFSPGQKFALQPQLDYERCPYTPGYSYPYFGGDCTYAVLPAEVMERGNLLAYEGESYFEASLGEPVSCVMAGYRVNHHADPARNHGRRPGSKAGGCVLIEGGCGPMGLMATEYPLALEEKPRLVVVTDIDPARLARAKRVIPPGRAAQKGIELHYLNPRETQDLYGTLLSLSGGRGYDDVFVYAPKEELVELGDRLLAPDGCLNFFAGPLDSSFSARLNLYNCHYAGTHFVGVSGSTTQDLRDAIDLAAAGKIRPAVMVTHVGGLDAVVDTVGRLPDIPGGKKLIYTQIEMPLVALDDFEKRGEEQPLFARLAQSCKNHEGLWNAQAEKLLLEHFGVAAAEEV
ncbi:zinc-binding dehydrogenase [Ruminococcaceae bacterium OttesenSCG-928-I18]|nr:zinc-binding dehydrogenase [Ruminococcaceae bacterium OttesenSCG-928-I18]